jgi:hypothetical protein
MIVKKPLPIILSTEKEKFSGFVMQLTNTGLMVELEKIPFKVGVYLDATIQFNEKTVLTERVRAIKNYSKFYRTPPSKKPKPGEVLAEPKMLAELHFQMLSESSKVVIAKFLIINQTGS